MGESGGPAVGIDLGTTYSCVSVWQNDQAVIIINSQGNRTTPSYVSFNATQRYVGDAAKFDAAVNATNTIFDSKRLIGRKTSDPTVQSDMRHWPFRVIAGPNDKPKIVVKYKGEENQFAAEEISALILSDLKKSAEVYLRCPVSKAVVTVPAYFTDSQRQATKDAAKIAGLDVLQILNEPTAAAIAYGLQNRKSGGGRRSRRALIFDLGGGTLDVSLVDLDAADSIFVRAIDGNNHLGGEDFDNRVVTYMAKEFTRKHGADVTASPASMRQLRTECERVKRVLSTSYTTQVVVNSLYQGINFQCQISRAKFEQLNEDLFDSCLEPVKRCLLDARIEKSSIDDIVLVGGSTRIPMVQTLLKEFFEVDSLNMSVNPDEAVAMGAAIQADRLNRDPEDHSKLHDVTPLSLGLNIWGGITQVMIPRNSPIPCSKEKSFTTAEDNTTNMRFRVYEGERAESELNNLLGEFYMSGIRRAPKGSVRIRVTFRVDVDGILVVSAVDEESGRKIEVTMTNESGRLARDDIKRMIEDARRFEEEDEERRMAVAAKSELESYVSVVAAQIRRTEVASRLTAAQTRTLQSKIKELREWADACQHAPLYVVEDKKNSLRMIWEPIRNNLRTASTR